MSTVTPTRRRRRFGVFGVAAAAAIGAASLMPAASAAPVDLTAPLTGTFDVNGSVVTVPDGSSFTGTWDDELFTFEGNVGFAPITTSIVTQIALLPGQDIDVDVVIQISEVDPTAGISGSWDPDAGTAQASVDLQVEVVSLFAHIGDGVPIDLDSCVLGPFTASFEEANSTMDHDANGFPVLSFGPDWIAIPPAAAGACAITAPLPMDLTDQVNDALSGDNSQATIGLSLAPDQDVPETTTTTTTVPDVTTTTEAPADPPAAGGAGAAPGATPVSGTPSYTG